VFNLMVPDAVQVADPFHVVKVANSKLDECRRRAVSAATLDGHEDDMIHGHGFVDIGSPPWPSAVA
jgi:hypothetical protein